jgi:carboxylesterase
MAMRGGEPIGTQDLPGGAPAVLALHGFGATPQEVEMVVELAQELGLRVLAPLLPGHGTTVQDLAQRRWPEWRQAANDALDQLLLDPSGKRRGPAIVVGSSMGSLLGLELAADRPGDVLGLGILASPIRLRWLFPSLALKVWCGLGVPDFNLPKGSPDIHDAVLRARQVTYEAQPCYAGNELRLAGQRLQARLGEIHCPAFIAHGQRDHVCPVSNARLLYRALGTPAWEKQLLILPRSYHIITRDIERGALRGELYRFLTRLLPLAEQGSRPLPRTPSPPQTPVDPYPPPALPVSDRLSATSS